MIKLFAVGFSRSTDELQLYELFSQQGLVQTLTIVRDQQTGVSKGYAFVQMLDQAGAERAIQHLNGLRLDDRTLSVRYADKPHKKDIISAKSKHPADKRRVPASENRTRRPRLGGK